MNAKTRQLIGKPKEISGEKREVDREQDRFTYAEIVSDLIEINARMPNLTSEQIRERSWWNKRCHRPRKGGICTF